MKRFLHPGRRRRWSSPTDSALNVEPLHDHQFDPTELLVYIWNSTQNQTMDIPFALIVAC